MAGSGPIPDGEAIANLPPKPRSAGRRRGLSQNRIRVCVCACVSTRLCVHCPQQRGRAKQGVRAEAGAAQGCTKGRPGGVFEPYFRCGAVCAYLRRIGLAFRAGSDLGRRFVCSPAVSRDRVDAVGPGPCAAGARARLPARSAGRARVSRCGSLPRR